jgi:hypothetical protein
MYNQQPGISSTFSLRKLYAGLFFFIAILFVSLPSYGQSYFYFENKIAPPNSSEISLYSFVILQPDGTAKVRVRSTDNSLVEQTMTDSVLADQSISGDLKYLVPSGDPTIYAAGAAGEYKLRFIFKRQADSADTYYVPVKTQYLDKDQKWQEVSTISSQEKTYTDLIKQRNFVKIFFNEDDDFYKYIFYERLRAVNATKKEKLFLITIANTNDEKIGITSKKDFDDINSMFTTLAANLGMKLISTKIMGNDFNKKNVDLAIDNLNKQKPSPIDIVIFYYSGHGFRYSNDTSLYPRMSLRTNPDQDIDKNNISVEDVYKQILKLGARVNMVLTDCCNQDIGANSPIGRDVLKTRGGGYNATAQSLNMDNCNALFFSKQPVSIIASSAQINQLATGNPALGGFFTYYFKGLLEKSLYSYDKSNSWFRILLDAKEKARWQALSALCGAGRCVQLAELKVNPPQ